MKKLLKRTTDGHTWRFFRAGGFDQVRLDSGQDLTALAQLDQKLWVALACPVDNVHFDAHTLALIDTDGDRRVRATELIAALKWTLALLKNPDDLLRSSVSIAPAAINATHAEGQALVAAAQNALAALGKSADDALTITDMEALEKVLAQKAYNGDGVITADAAADEKTRRVIQEITSVLGPVMDRSGQPGVNAEQVASFFAQARTYNEWALEAETNSALLPLGTAAAEAAAAIALVQGKVDDYFARCAVAEFDERAGAVLNGGEKELAALSGKQLSGSSAEIADLPLARIIAGNPLPLGQGLNPAWHERINQFTILAVRPLLGGKTVLTQAEWTTVLSAFSPWFAWQARKPAAALDTLGSTRVRELLAGNEHQTLESLIEQDLAEAATFTALGNLEKLTRFHRDLYRLCINFVSFKDFYAKSSPAMFQAGTLYIDQRSCDLCLKVDDVSRHVGMAAMASIYLLYCECTRRASGQKMSIVAALTNGEADNLMVGRNGVFYDRAGNDWDATVIKIIENPISLRQAFWLPYKSLVRMIESQVAKRATAGEAQAHARLNQTAVTTANVDKTRLEPPPKKLDIGVVAALGVAAGALGTFVATLLGYGSGLVRLGPLAIIAALGGFMLLISGPSMVLAYIKLRKRNLGPILDASGWAVNAKARINVPFGAVLTHVATLPPGAQRDLVDPYAEKKSPWPKVLAVALFIYMVYAALNHLGFINDWTGGRLGIQKSKAARTVVIEKEKPAPPAPAPAAQQ